MIESGDDFFHPSVHAWLKNGGDFKVDGHSFKAEAKARELDLSAMLPNTKRMEFEAHFALSDEHWCKLAISFKRQDPVADVWAMCGYGSTATSKPMISRRTVNLTDQNGEDIIPRPLDATHNAKVLHGQAIRPTHFTFDFRNGAMSTMTDIPEPFTPTPWIPADGNQTGGRYPYMGVTIVTDSWTVEDCRREFYAMAGYGGHFVTGVVPDSHKRDGILVRENMYPNAVLASGAHFHRDTPTWINYTHKEAPWSDSATMRNPNTEHYSIYDGPAQAGKLYPWDIGLRWLNAFAAERFLMQVPGRDKGTYRWDPSSARARGRILKYAVNALGALEAYGMTDRYKRVAARAAQRFQHQVDEWVAMSLQGADIWPRFDLAWPMTTSKKVAPHEVGIWFWGLKACSDFVDKLGVSVPTLPYMLEALAEFVFNAYWIDEEGRPQLPYYVTENWDHPPQKSASGEHFGYLAATHHQPRTLTEERKMAKILEMGETLSPRWQG